VVVDSDGITNYSFLYFSLCGDYELCVSWATGFLLSVGGVKLLVSVILPREALAPPSLECSKFWAVTGRCVNLVGNVN
jgi:hypothetical protein